MWLEISKGSVVLVNKCSVWPAKSVSCGYNHNQGSVMPSLPKKKQKTTHSPFKNGAGWNKHFRGVWRHLRLWQSERGGEVVQALQHLLRELNGVKKHNVNVKPRHPALDLASWTTNKCVWLFFFSWSPAWRNPWWRRSQWKLGSVERVGRGVQRKCRPEPPRRPAGQPSSRTDEIHLRLQKTGVILGSDFLSSFAVNLLNHQRYLATY